MGDRTLRLGVDHWPDVGGDLAGIAHHELGRGPGEIPHLPEHYDFRNGKMWPNRRPGLGVTLDTQPLQLVAEITQRSRPVPMLARPDGSITNW